MDPVRAVRTGSWKKAQVFPYAAFSSGQPSAAEVHCWESDPQLRSLFRLHVMRDVYSLSKEEGIEE